MGEKSSPKNEPSLEDSLDEHERPTVHPPFDVAAFARAQTAALAEEHEQRHSERITITNEAELERATSPDPTPRNWPPVGEQARRASDGPAGPEITQLAIEDPLAEMRRCFSLEDYAGALAIAELILAEDPRNLAAAGCRENCRIRLENKYAVLVAPKSVPKLVLPLAHARAVAIDHRAPFLLSLVDGTATVEAIVDESGVPKLDALRILYELDRQQIIRIGRRR